MLRGSLGNTRLMFYVAELRQLLARDFSAGFEDSFEQKIKSIDQRFLAAKINIQWLLRAAGCFDRCGYLRKYIDVGAAKSVDRLFAIADDEQVRAGGQREPDHRIALQGVSIL